MIQTITRMVVLAMAFGFLFSCSGTSYIDKAEELRTENKLNEALRAANQAARQQPENPQAHLLKASIIAELSKNHQPADRRDLYSDLVAAANQATSVASEAELPDIKVEADQIRNERAETEYEAAQSILGSSEYARDDNKLTAASHLENARILKPSESRYYDILFELYYEMDRTDDAILTLQDMHAGSLGSDRHKASLGYLLVKEERYEEAIPVLRDSWNEGQGLINSGRGLANALLKTGRDDEAYEVLDLLSRLDGQTVESKLGFARILTERGMEKLRNAYEISGSDERAETYKEARELLEAADRELDAALVLDQDHQLTNLSYGLYHRNLGLELTRLYEAYPDLSSEEDPALAAEDHFYQSLSYLELVAEQSPNDTTVWRALADVYFALGMDDQAEDARSRYERL